METHPSASTETSIFCKNFSTKPVRSVGKAGFDIEDVDKVEEDDDEDEGDGVKDDNEEEDGDDVKAGAEEVDIR
jgi:hypothetical protein